MGSNEKNNQITGMPLPVVWLTETPPEQEFCVNPLVPIGAVTLLNAHGGTGKSLFALKMAIHIVLGLPIIGAETNGGKVAYMSLEDSENIVRNRLFKIVRAFPEETRQRIAELTSKVMLIDRYGVQTHMAVVNHTGGIRSTPIAHDLSKLLQENNISCLFVDTFIRTHALNENDNAQMGALLVAFERIAKEAKCGVVLIHHIPKGGDNKAYAARGASAITDNARSVLLMEKKDGLIKVAHTKHNHSAPYPDQYLEMTEDGVLMEALSFSEVSFIQKKRYQELYEWWEDVWGRKELTKTNIDDNVEKIRPPNTSYGKNVYKKVLDWALAEGYTEEVPAPENKSNNPKAKYYTLSPIVEQ